MKKKFLHNLSFLVFLNVIIKTFWVFGIDRQIINTFGEDVYGLYFSVFNFSFLFHMFLDLGLHYYNNRTIAQDASLLDKYFSGIVLLKIILSIVYVIITFGIATFFDFDVFQIRLLVWLAINQILISFIFYVRSNIAALHWFKKDSLLSVLDKTLMIILCGWLLVFIPKNRLQIEWFVYAQTIAYAITLIVSLLVVSKAINYIKFKIDWSFLLNLFKKSYPYTILVLLMSLYNRIDAVMLGEMLDTGVETGIYASAFKILDAFNMLGFLFATLLLPMFSKMIKDKVSIEPLFQLSSKLIIVISSIIGTTCFFFKGRVMKLLYINGSAYSGEILGLLMLSFVAISLIYITGTLLSANDNLKALNILAILGLCLNIGLNYYLIPTEKALGATYATIFTQFLILVGQFIIIKFSFNFKTNITLIVKLLVFILVLIFLASHTITLSIDWKISFVVTAFGGLILAFLLRVINPKELLSAFK